MIKWPGLGICETAWAGCKKGLVSTRNYLPGLQRGTSSVFGLFHKLLMIPPVIWMPVEMFSRTVASGLLACPLWSSFYGLPWWIVTDGLLVHMRCPLLGMPSPLPLPPNLVGLFCSSDKISKPHLLQEAFTDHYPLAASCTFSQVLAMYLWNYQMNICLLHCTGGFMRVGTVSHWLPVSLLPGPKRTWYKRAGHWR